MRIVGLKLEILAEWDLLSEVKNESTFTRRHCDIYMDLIPKSPYQYS